MQVFTGEYGCAVLKSHAFRGWVQHKSAQNLQGNRDNKPLNSICWNERVNCLACVSDNCAKVWSTDGQPVRELNRNGCFRSRSFHPRYPNTLVIGRYEVSIFALYFLRSDRVVLTEWFVCSFLGYIVVTFSFVSLAGVENVQSITLWNFAENKVESVQAHGCNLSDL